MEQQPVHLKWERYSSALVIASVADNPKLPGSEAHAIYKHYRPGMTIGDFLASTTAAGHTYKYARSNVGWDYRHGFITLAHPDSPVVNFTTSELLATLEAIVNVANAAIARVRGK